MARKPIFIVTGAAGHLGGYVVRELLSQGFVVRALVLPGETCPAFIDVNRHLLTEYTGNVCKPGSLSPLFEDFETESFTVVHCAGIVAITQKPDERLYAVNVCGTENIIAACKQYRVKRLVYISSVHAIPPLPCGQTMCEVESFCPDKVPGYYDKTKAIATQRVLDAVKEGLDAVVIHPSGIIGPNGLPTGNMMHLIARYITGKLPAAVSGGFDFVDVRDVASGIVAAAAKGRRGGCYVLSNRFVNLKELFGLLSQASGRKELKLYLPLWVAKAVAPFAEVYYRLSGKTPFFTRYSLKTLSENGVFSHKKASRELGYRPRPLKETLFDTVAWLKKSPPRSTSRDLLQKARSIKHKSI
jgi:dihydroflavonol-4-reductase